jgi:hypothetical protein
MRARSSTATLPQAVADFIFDKNTRPSKKNFFLLPCQFPPLLPALRDRSETMTHRMKLSALVEFGICVFLLQAWPLHAARTGACISDPSRQSESHARRCSKVAAA